MLKMYKKDQGLTLVELLVVIALVGVVASIAFPVVSNVIAGATADADAASTKAVDNFTKEYANFNLAQVGGDIVATTDGGTEIARIAGTLNGGAPNAPVLTTYTFNSASAWTSPFRPETFAMEIPLSSGSPSTVAFRVDSTELRSKLQALSSGSTLEVNGVALTVSSVSITQETDMMTLLPYYRASITFSSVPSNISITTLAL